MTSSHVEPFFVPEWSSTNVSAVLSEAVDALWPKRSLAELYVRPEIHSPAQNQLDALGITVRGNIDSKLVKGLMVDGDPWSRHVGITTGWPTRYVDPATRTVVTSDAVSVQHRDLGDVVRMIIDHSWWYMQHAVWRSPWLLADIDLGAISGDMLRLALSLPSSGRPAFSIKNPPAMSPPLEAVARLVGHREYTSAHLLWAYREAGGTAANIAEVMGQLRGALGLTNEAETIRGGIVGTLRCVAARFAASGNADAAGQVREWAESEEQVNTILAGFYR